MIYRVKEKFWSFGDNFAIKDEYGNDCFYVKGKVFSWGDNLSFQDKDRNEIAVIKQKLFTLLPKYQIFIDGELYADIQKQWSWFKKKFTLDVPGPNDYTIEGSFWGHEFSFIRNNREVATISKKLFAWRDSYSVDIKEDENHAAIIITCIVIDQILHDGNHS
ncbi:LURP-one-related [Kordia sp. SMS9]|uniref:LURP-one-related/scramblase family protein n=1 Tax=Kordia sp. SMS9 TaxID=2282170 RepID=UPI000E0D54A9|nr:LURP-one-related family protein [Kordia sp. SMS9]AXG67983.1 LURP-one-related [Kordia sp. SMS9]